MLVHLAVCELVAMNLGSWPNGIKLSSTMLLFQGVTCYPTRFHEERIRFGPAFDVAGLDAVWSLRIDHLRGQWFPWASGAEPPHGVDETDTIGG